MIMIAFDNILDSQNMLSLMQTLCLVISLITTLYHNNHSLVKSKFNDIAARLHNNIVIRNVILILVTGTYTKMSLCLHPIQFLVNAQHKKCSF